MPVNYMRCLSGLLSRSLSPKDAIRRVFFSPHLKDWSTKTEYAGHLPGALSASQQCPISDIPPKPYVFNSGVCREVHFRLPLFRYWSSLLNRPVQYHRKYWEWIYVSHALYERGMLEPGREGLGFGVGREPLVSLFAAHGTGILATDLDVNRAAALGWVSTSQHSSHLRDLTHDSICKPEMFERLVRFRSVDMNDVPDDLGTFDFCWSSCALEHLGSIEKGLRFIRRSLDFLKPGGYAVHTTEFNLSSDVETIHENPNCVLFRRKDFLQHRERLMSEGYQVEPIDFTNGNEDVERYVDLPPYGSLVEPHLRLELYSAARKYVTTSIGLIIGKPS